MLLCCLSKSLWDTSHIGGRGGCSVLTPQILTRTADQRARELWVRNRQSIEKSFLFFATETTEMDETPSSCLYHPHCLILFQVFLHNVWPVLLEFTSKELCHDSIFPVLLQNRKNRSGNQRKLKIIRSCLWLSITRMEMARKLKIRG